MKVKSKYLQWTKRVTAFLLVQLMIITTVLVSPGYNHAAAKKPTMPEKAVVLMNGTETLRISGEGYKIVSIKAKSSATAVKAEAKKKSITLYGVKAGSAKITTTVQAQKGKKRKNFTFKTRVTVKKPSATLAQTSLEAGTFGKVKVSNVVSGAKVSYNAKPEMVANVDKNGQISAIEEGEAKISVKIVLPKTKYAKKKSLTIEAGTITVTGKADVTVENQDELEKALLSKSLKMLTIGEKAETITIPEGDYKDVELLVNSPKGSITNKGNFKTITIKAIAANTYTEQGDKNTIIVACDTMGNFIVDTEKSVQSITFIGTVANVGQLLVKKGSVRDIFVKLSGIVAVKASGSGSIETITANNGSTVGVNAENGGKVQTVKLVGDAKATLTGNVSVVDISQAGANAKATLNTSSIKVEKGTNTNNNIIVNNATGGGSTTGGGGGGVSVIIPDGGNNKTETTTESTGVQRLQEKIETAEVDKTIALTEDVSGNVIVNRKEAGTLKIDFGKHKISGSLTINAPNMERLEMIDAAEDEKGAVVTGNLIVNAPKAHVESELKVNGTIKIEKVKDESFVQFDSAQVVEMWGGGKLEYGDNLAQVPPVEIKTSEQVILSGGIQEVTVKNPDAKLEVADNTSISKIVVPAAAASENKAVEISGEGSISNLETSAPVKVSTNVTNVTAKSQEAKIEVESGKKISNITADSGVKKIEITGDGQVESIDLTKVTDVSELQVTGADNVTLVATAEQKEGMPEELKAKVVSVQTVTVEYKNTDDNDDIVYAVGEQLKPEEYIITVTYNDESQRQITPTADMFTGFDSSKAGMVTYSVTYATVTSNSLTAIVKASDTLSVSCSVGKYTYERNGDGEYFDCWAMDTSYFDNLSEVMTVTSQNGLDLNWMYKELMDKNEDENFTPGKPSQPGNYCIKVESADSDATLGSEIYFWVKVAPDTLTVDQEAIKAAVVASGIEWAEYDEKQEDGYDYELTLPENYDLAGLENLLTSMIKSHNGSDLCFSYFVQGSQENDAEKGGLPASINNYGIWVWSQTMDEADGFGIYMFHKGTKPQHVSIGILYGVESKGAIDNYTTNEGGKLTGTGHSVEDPFVITYEAEKNVVITGKGAIDSSGIKEYDDFYVKKVTVQQGSFWKAESMDGENLNGKGKYVICAEKKADQTYPNEKPETWAYFFIEIR